MGIFNKLAGLLTKEEKAEEDTEEKLLIAALVNLKKALKSTNKTQNKIDYILEKSDSLNGRKSIEKLLGYYQEIVKEGIQKTIIPLNITNNYMKTLKKKIEATAATPSNYRKPVYSKKYRLLLNVVEMVPERISKVIKDLSAHEGEVKEVPTVNIMEPHWDQMSTKCRLWIKDSEELFYKSKRMIEKCIQDLENALASQA